MHEPLIILLKEHENMTRLFNLLEGQLNTIENKNLIAVLGIVNYIKDYNASSHHPKEEQVFDILLKKDMRGINLPFLGQVLRGGSRGLKVIEELQAEHLQLQVKLGNLERTIEQERHAPNKQLEEIAQKGFEYLSLHRKHIAQEEAKAFPLVEKHLNNKDWQELEKNFQNLGSPHHISELETSYLKFLEVIGVSGQSKK